ncbi:MAG: hypothetical protein ACE5JV_03150 [Nitrososphaerales archaeon]
MSDSSRDSEPRKVPKMSMYAASTIVAVIISVPGIVAFLLVWRFTDSMINALIVSVVVYFISMGFSVKVSKRIKIVRED